MAYAQQDCEPCSEHQCSSEAVASTGAVAGMRALQKCEAQLAEAVASTGAVAGMRALPQARVLRVEHGLRGACRRIKDCFSLGRVLSSCLHCS